MYRITYIRLTTRGTELVSLSHPNLDAAKTVHDALALSGVHVRMWDKHSKLIVPRPAVAQSEHHWLWELS